MKSLENVWRCSIPLFPLSFWNNPTTSPTDCSNFFTSKFEDSVHPFVHLPNDFAAFCKDADHISFENTNRPSIRTNRAPPPREGILVDIPSSAPMALMTPISDHLSDLKTVFMDVGSSCYPQRSWEIPSQPLYVEPEEDTWLTKRQIVNSRGVGLSLNRTFEEFASPFSPHPTTYAIRSPWPSEIFSWATSLHKLSPHSPYPDSPPEGFGEDVFEPSSTPTLSSIPDSIQGRQSKVDPRPFLCIEEYCDRSAPGNGFATKSGCGAHWRRQHATHCEKCSLGFTSPQLLKEHRKKVHTANICQESGCPRNSLTNGFRLVSQLKSHWQNCHLRAKAYHCTTILGDETVCAADFSAIEMLQAHKRRVHRAKSQLCTKEGCPRSTSGNGFKLKSQLKLHLQTHK